MKVFSLIFPLILLIIGLFSSISVFIGIVVLYLIFIYYTNRQVLYRLKSKYFFSFIAILLFIYPLFGEQKDILLPFSMGYDFNYLEMSIKMSLRAILLFGFSNVLLLQISTSKILSKLKFAESDQLIEIAMNNYEKIAQKTISHFKSNGYKVFKINQIFDYLAIFMAELLSQEALYSYVPQNKNENL